MTEHTFKAYVSSVTEEQVLDNIADVLHHEMRDDFIKSDLYDEIMQRLEDIGDDDEIYYCDETGEHTVRITDDVKAFAAYIISMFEVE